MKDFALIELAFNKIFFPLFASESLVGRVGEVIDIAYAVAYLAADSGSFLTGVLLPTDGGFTLTLKS